MATGLIFVISLQRQFLFSKGGKSATEVLKHAFPAVIARPALAENYNCGGAVKTGSVLQEPHQKRNIMGSKIQMLLEQACQRAQPELSSQQFKTLLSDFLKRSSQLKGGSHHKQKHASSSTMNAEQTGEDND